MFGQDEVKITWSKGGQGEAVKSRSEGLRMSTGGGQWEVIDRRPRRGGQEKIKGRRSPFGMLRNMKDADIRNILKSNHTKALPLGPCSVLLNPLYKHS